VQHGEHQAGNSDRRTDPPSLMSFENVYLIRVRPRGATGDPSLVGAGFPLQALSPTTRTLTQAATVIGPQLTITDHHSLPTWHDQPCVVGSGGSKFACASVPE
jgi:hypothetical protein